MTNSKTRKTEKSSKDAVVTNNSNIGDGDMADEMDEVDAMPRGVWIQNDMSDDEIDDTEDADDDDEVINDGDTSTSFSLQECMNEFRARRIRRISSSQNRHDAEKGGVGCGDNCHDATELDLINQNLCNKEQERKCKPCKDGFCYCFTSDSGDGGGGSLGGCGIARGIHVRHSRRNRRSECNQASVSGKHTKSPRSQETRRQSAPSNLKIPQKHETNKRESTKFADQTQITAISRLETSQTDAPLIHIIQELRDNCVISEVRVNKHKIQAVQGPNTTNGYKTHVTQTTSNKKAHFKEPSQFIKISEKKIQRNSTNKFPLESHTPTAPPLERISELDTPQTTTESVLSTPLDDRGNKFNYTTERRHKAGGRLLQKRLSNTHFSYKPRNLKEPPPKPPRSSLSLEDKSYISTTSTSPSVREAERVVDEFLAKKGFTTKSTPVKEQTSKISSEQIKFNNRCENYKRKSYPLIPKELNKQLKKIIPTYPSLSDIERIVESKKSTHYEKNIRQITENQQKVISIGWNETKINDMLNYDSNTKSKEFRSTETQAQPQQRSGRDIVGFEERIGWQIPPKIDLDTVDGAVRHNLASNIENKNTPVKTKLFPSNKSKGAPQTQKLLWSEQLRHLSPWSNKHSMNNTPKVNRKSNLRSSSKAFLKSSKKKILRLVSPKKENKERINFQIRKTPQRNVGIQTSRDDILHHHHRYEPSSTPQSPPGSYHSPVQSSQLQSPSSTQSQNTTPICIDSAHSHFDFSRTVHSPPKKAPRSSQRKLNFPLNCTATCSGNVDGDVTSTPVQEKKTYRSFNTDLDQDVSISKISYILRNIRAKLEASDEHAIRTFRETDRREEHHTSGFDCPDGHRGIRQETSVDIHGNSRLQLEQIVRHNEPIYSEIEDDSIHITESPDLDNHTGIEHFNVKHKPEILYAKVNKRFVDAAKFPSKQRQQIQQPTPLAKILHDSLKSKKNTTHITPLPPLSEPPESETTVYLSPSGQLLHCQSLNNVRVMEHNSPPKRQRNLSKSDLSLHRSEIFLDNLCKSELIIEGGCGGSDVAEREHLEKIQNNKKNQSYISLAQTSPNDHLNTSFESDQELLNNDTVSYEMPNDVDGAAESIDAYESTTAGSNLGLNTIAPPSSHNQSTPKKQSFTTKDDPNRCELNIDAMPTESLLYNGHSSMSCPNTPHKLNAGRIPNQRQTSHSHSLNEVFDYEVVKKSNPMSTSTLRRYKFLKNVLQKSFRKSKKFLKSESKRLSTSLSFSASNTVENKTLAQSTHSTLGSNLDLEALFSLYETASVNEQLVQTVSICRRLPNLEISTEMIEAERLLLFSALRREKQRNFPTKKNQTMNKQSKKHFFIDDMYLPIRSDVNKDIFFNYFYIVTFECDGIIKSTQSAECQNGSAVFRDCGIEFEQCSELKTNDNSCEQQSQQHAVRCNVFMLRLRKVSTLSIEPIKKNISETCTPSPSSSMSSSTGSSSSSNAIVSRFRLHASFTLDSTDFVPYEYVPQETNNSDRVCVRASCFCTIPLIPRTKSTNLARQLQLKGRAEVRFPKSSFAGFLNVEDPHSQHNWNRRWCTLDGIYLHVWHDVNILSELPLMSLDLRDSNHDGRYPLSTASRELCARPRSFCLDYTIRKADEDISTATVFFAADTQDNLDDWLKNLNIVLDFIIRWLS